MNSILAQYLFNKEVIYRNPPSTDIPVERTAVEKIAVPVANNTVPPPTPSLIPDNADTQIPKPVSLKLTNTVLVVTETISIDEKEFLTKILAAVGLSLSQIDLVEIQQTGHSDYSAFTTQKTATKFISFGIGPSKLNLNLALTPYHIKHESGIDFLMANSLSAISADTTLKKNLWAALQQMFGK